MTSHVGSWQRAKWKQAEHSRDPHCSYCGKVTTLDQHGGLDLATVDHVVAISRGGRDHPDNYALACLACNQAKGAGRYDGKAIGRHRQWILEAAYG